MTKPKHNYSKPKEKRAVGRPLITLDDLPKNWKMLMKNIASQGGGSVSARVALGISKDVWFRLQNEHEEFSTVVDECHDICQHWWETQGIKMTKTGKGSASVWRFNMQNRFNWREKVDTDVGGKPGQPVETKQVREMTEEEIQAELERRGLPSTVLDE